MKQKLVAAATLICSAMGVHAQSSGVTLYGALDAWVGRFSASGASSQTVQNSGFNPNVLGFAGAEDLGNGMAAGFILESQPVLDTGTVAQGGKLFGRRSQVYLRSASWGQLNFGRLHMPGRAFGIGHVLEDLEERDPVEGAVRAPFFF